MQPALILYFFLSLNSSDLTCRFDIILPLKFADNDILFPRSDYYIGRDFVVCFWGTGGQSFRVFRWSFASIGPNYQSVTISPFTKYNYFLMEFLQRGIIPLINSDFIETRQIISFISLNQTLVTWIKNKDRIWKDFCRRRTLLIGK